MTTMSGKDIEKFEEIKQKAWEFYCKNRHRNCDIRAAWREAEDFYNYAKEKQEEASDDDNVR